MNHIPLNCPACNEPLAFGALAKDEGYLASCRNPECKNQKAKDGATGWSALSAWDALKCAVNTQHQPNNDHPGQAQ